MTACSLLLLIGHAATQRDESGTRRLWDNEFLKPRIKATGGKPTTPKPRYQVVTPKIPAKDVSGDSVLGITIWRLRPSTVKDDPALRILKHKKDTSNVASWTPERIPAETPLNAGQRLRLSIEAARTGYLYVINREQYADGSTSDPYLIFPTLSIRGGDNQVTVGRIIDLPAIEDDPNYFTLAPGRPDQVGEIISLIISPHPLADLKIGEHEIVLPRDQVEQWEKLWGTKVGRMELEGGAGKTWTAEEKAASARQAQLLKREGPAPQTLYYRPTAKPDEPLLVSLKLSYRASKK